MHLLEKNRRRKQRVLFLGNPREYLISIPNLYQSNESFVSIYGEWKEEKKEKWEKNAKGPHGEGSARNS